MVPPPDDGEHGCAWREYAGYLGNKVEVMQAELEVLERAFAKRSEKMGKMPRPPRSPRTPEETAERRTEQALFRAEKVVTEKKTEPVPEALKKCGLCGGTAIQRVGTGKPSETYSYAPGYFRRANRAREARRASLRRMRPDGARAGAVGGQDPDSSGALLCDDYRGYDPLEQKGARVRCGCLAHARRKFFDAGDVPEAREALEFVNGMHRVEHEAERRGVLGAFAVIDIREHCKMSNGFLAVVLGVCAAAFAAACSDESPGGSTGTVGGGPTGTAGGTSSGGSNGVSTGAVADAGLWSPDHDLSLPSAYGFGVTAHAARGSIVTSAGTADPTGKVLRSVIPTTADEGYRGHTKLSSIAPSHFPRPSVAMEYEFRLSTIGGMQFVPAKVGYGLAGAPENADLWNGISYGGTKLSTSWSARLTALPADYLKWRPEYSAGHPWALCAYLYADYAGGRARGDYGIEHLLRDGDGNYFTPVEGQRYTVRVEITTNTPGVRDGRYRVTINGTEYMDLTDVQWNPSGVDQGVSHFLTQTFCNSAISSSATLDQGNLRLLSL